MKFRPAWIGKKALLMLHEESLSEFGGARGLRDEGLLESALARPQNAYADRAEETVASLAASYAFGIARNHPFMDGNKRAAFLSVGLFLALNGWRLEAGQPDAVGALLALSEGSLDEKGFSAWLALQLARRSA